MTGSNLLRNLSSRNSSANGYIHPSVHITTAGKELWGHDGSDPAPTDSKELLQWNVKDTRGNLSIQEYFSGFQNLWAEFTDLVYAKRPLTKSTFKQENTVMVAFVAKGKGKGRDMNNILCYSCKEYGHIAANCGKKFYNYYKQLGHIIKECPTRPQNRRANASSATMNSSNHFAAPAISTTPSTAAEPVVLTPEMVQQMIVSAFSALGLQVNDIASSQFWLVDSAASNHMTNSSSMLKNVHKYHGSIEIQIANESNIPITKVGDLTPSFKNIFISPKLSTKLISVDQLVDNNCDVHFSHNGYLVQDQVSGTPGFVYERRQQTLLFLETDPPLAPTSEPTFEISYELAPPEPILRRSTRVSRAPNWPSRFIPS
ncbi:hypothetical protein GH714_033949 [Hevea brasiliensis]|uniref:CCHC-type domain-containing protein n=1 Tax=Hevea brasiliensis TaxID=3981 RepID=A0A6A6L340_HEVBR|nr:hypothetical protein GH714_033949 [Hevea brasiliensis]